MKPDFHLSRVIQVDTFRFFGQMNLEEFEARSRNALEEILNHLQTTNFLVARAATQAEAAKQIEATGRSAQSLAQLIEEFVAQQRK